MDLLSLISKMDLKDIVTACISITNIITTIILAFLNNYYALKNKRETAQRDALCHYYLKVLNLANDIVFSKALANNVVQDIDIFDPKTAAEKKLVENVLKQYVAFDTFVRTNTPCYCESSIDTLIQQSMNHVRFFLAYQQANEQEKSIYKQSKQPYLPDGFQSLINEIKGWLEL